MTRRRLYLKPRLKRLRRRSNVLRHRRQTIWLNLLPKIKSTGGRGTNLIYQRQKGED
ncbi:hypothetical protein [Citrobacter phage Tr1]|nr:hypothetical protein [Citrobacter phage Tr1]